MTQTPQTPPGWYPANGEERWWDGNAWSEHRRPLPAAAPPAQPVPAYGAPAQQAYGAPAYGMQPVKQSHTARNVLIIIGVLFVLLVGGCFAVVAVVGNKVNDVVDTATANDDAPGGPNNPLPIAPGKAFSVRKFDYQAGWGISADTAGDMQVTDLKLTNHRGKADFVFVEIKMLKGTEVLATSTCTEDSRVGDGTTVTLACISGDLLPTDFDAVTINDSF